MKTESASRSSTRESRISSTADLAVIVSQSRFDDYVATRCGNQATLTLKSQISLRRIRHAFHAFCRLQVESRVIGTNRRLISRYSVQQLGIPQPEQADSRAPRSRAHRSGRLGAL